MMSIVATSICDRSFWMNVYWCSILYHVTATERSKKNYDPTSQTEPVDGHKYLLFLNKKKGFKEKVKLILMFALDRMYHQAKSMFFLFRFNHTVSSFIFIFIL